MILNREVGKDRAARMTLEDRIPLVAVSSCLLGEKVRYDGTDKYCASLSELAGQIRLVAVCPEVEIGLGIPRQPIQLVAADGEIRVRGVEDRTLDVTDRLLICAEEVVNRLAVISGYIFKSGSPSCGIKNAMVYSKDFNAKGSENGTGIFAGRILGLLEDLPFEDEKRLGDVHIRQQFLAKVLKYHRRMIPRG